MPRTLSPTAAAIRYARNVQGHTRATLAADLAAHDSRFDTEKWEARITRIELDRRPADVDDLLSLSSVLGVSLEFLARGPATIGEMGAYLDLALPVAA